MRARWESALASYRRKGVTRGAVSAVRRMVPGGGVAQAYQAKTSAALAQRLVQLDGAVPAASSNLLDIGCNLGDITAHFARRGLWTVGLDRSERLVGAARRRHRREERCAFVLMDVRPENLGCLPSFDVVLLLSVHQHWVMSFGIETASSMLRSLVERTNHAVIYEGASRRSRYGDFDPGFADNDPISVTGFHEDYLRSTVSDLVGDMVPLGETPCVGDREPLRWAYALQRTA